MGLCCENKTIIGWRNECVGYDVEGSRPRGRQKKTWREIVEKDCQARKLNMDNNGMRKLTKDGCLNRIGVSGWMFLLVLAHSVVPYRALKRFVLLLCKDFTVKIIKEKPRDIPCRTTSRRSSTCSARLCLKWMKNRQVIWHDASRSQWQEYAIGEILHIYPSRTESMGDRGSKKAYTGPRTGIYLPTKYGCDRSIVVGCRSRNDRQTSRQTNRMEWQ